MKTHCVLGLSLVALDFGLKLIDQLLHPQQSLPVLLRLQGHKENQFKSMERTKNRQNIRLILTEAAAG